MPKHTANLIANTHSSLFRRAARPLAASFLIAAAACSTLTSLSLAQPTSEPGPYVGHKVVRVAPRTVREHATVMANVENVWSCREGISPLDVQVTAAQEAQLIALGLDPQVMIADVQALLDAERNQILETYSRRDAAWFSTFRTLTEINAKLDEYATVAPSIVSLSSAGGSLENRPIRVIRITGPDTQANPRASRPQILFNGTQHAREWASPMTLMWIADQMVSNYATDSRIRAIVDTFEVILVPVVNPDGYEYTWTPNNRLWRKNRRPNSGGSFGVDLNRNWGYEWGGIGSNGTQNSDTYRGAAAFSEPETQALRDLFISCTRLKAHIDFHSYGQYILEPWGFTTLLPEEYPLIYRISADMQSALAAPHGMFYRPGPSFTNIYPTTGGIKDWVFGDQRRLSWTIELRDTGQTGFVLPAAQIIPTAEENFGAIMSLAEFVRDPLYFSFPTELPTTLSTSTPTPIDVSVRSGTGTLDSATVRLTYRIGDGSPTTLSMPQGAPATFSAILPGVSCNERVSYFIEASTTDGRTIRYPADAPASEVIAFGTDEYLLHADDMETNTGWNNTIGSNNATGGRFEWGDPQPTTAQPGDDASPNGTQCWMTGLAAGTGVGSFDLDNGSTSITSPNYDVRAPRHVSLKQLRVGYARWFSDDMGSNPNQDILESLVSMDDGTTWRRLELTGENRNAWVRRSYDILPFINSNLTARFRFTATDDNGGSIVEAGIDDLTIIARGCRRNGDINQDGGADTSDILDLANMIASGVPGGDFNEDGTADTSDVIDLADLIAGG